MASLRQKAFSGVFWSAAQRGCDQGIHFVVSLVLARLLAPEQFGLLAMVTVFVTLATGFSDGGFSFAVIQRKKVTQTDLSSVFYFNLFLAGLMVGVLYVVAPAVAAFYRQPELTELLRFIAIAVPFAALGKIHLTKFSKELRFRTMLSATLPATVISGGVAITLAFQGWGVWALAYQAILQQGLRSLFAWFASSWRPSLEFSWASIRSMFPYGSRLAVAGFLNQAFENLYVLVIGRVFSPVDLGFYQRAQGFKRMTALNLNYVVGRVTFPVYSSIQDDPKRLKTVFIKTVFLLSLLCFPAMALMAGVAEPLIVTLIGEKWTPAAPYLSLLAVVGSMYPLNSINLSILKALGHSKLFLRLEILKRTLTLLVLFVTFRYGLYAILLGQIGTSLIALWINAFYNRQLIFTSYIEQVKVCTMPALLALAVFGASFVQKFLPIEGSLTRLIYGLVAGGSVLGIGIYLGRYRIQPELEMILRTVPAGNAVRRILYA